MSDKVWKTDVGSQFWVGTSVGVKVQAVMEIESPQDWMTPSFEAGWSVTKCCGASMVRKTNHMGKIDEVGALPAFRLQGCCFHRLRKR